MKDFRKELWVSIIIILLVVFCLAYMYHFAKCSSMNVWEMPGYCIYLLSNK